MVSDLGRGVGAVAELVLQPHQLDRVAHSIGRHARDQEAAEAPRRIGQGEEAVAHRRRAEPLVARQPPPVARAFGAGGVGAHVRAALLLGHGHAERDPALRGDGREPRVVAAAQKALQPGCGHRRGGAQRRHRRVGHVDRAHDARLGLGEHREQGGVSDVAAGQLAGPRQVMDLVVHGQPHQRMPGGVEAHLVQPAAVAVEGGELGRMAVGLHAPAQHLLASRCRAQSPAARVHPVAALAPHRLAQRRVGRIEVEVRRAAAAGWPPRESPGGWRRERRARRGSSIAGG